MIDPWKLLFTGGLISLILGSLITIVVIRQLVPGFNPSAPVHSETIIRNWISRLGGIGIAWASQRFCCCFCFLWTIVESITDLTSQPILGIYPGSYACLGSGLC